MLIGILLLYTIENIDKYDKNLIRIIRILQSRSIPFFTILYNEVPVDKNFTHIIILDRKTIEKLSLPQWVKDIKVPVFGFGLGMELIAEHLNFEMIYGVEEKNIKVCGISKDKQTTKIINICRSRKITSVIEGFNVLAIGEDGSIISFTDEEKWYGVQYNVLCKDKKDIILKFLTN